MSLIAVIAAAVLWPPQNCGCYSVTSISVSDGSAILGILACWLLHCPSSVLHVDL